MNQFTGGWALMLGLAVGCVGCSPGSGNWRTTPAEGRVTLDGQPVEGVAVTFIRPSGTSATGITDELGRFSLRAFEDQDGVEPGVYMAIVNKTVEILADDDDDLESEPAEGMPRNRRDRVVGVREAMPAKYTQPNPAWTFTVPDGGVMDLRLELTSDEGEE